MDKTEQLTKLIEKAMDKGYEPPWDGEWDNTDCVVWDTHGDPWPIEVILFGDNLSFLESLFGDSPFWRTQFEPGQDGDPKCDVLQVGGPNYLLQAWRLVSQPEKDRIPWLYNEVFGGRS